MNRVKAILTKTLLVLPILLGSVVALAPTDADAQIRVGVDVGVPMVNVYPPSAYIATATPEYYEGRPVYYYGNQWYYRDHGRWSYYRAEPGYLRDRRARWVDRRGYDNRVYRGPARYRYHR